MFKIAASEIDAAARSLEAVDGGELPADVRALCGRLSHGDKLEAQLDKLLRSGNSEYAARVLRGHPGTRRVFSRAGIVLVGWLSCLPFTGAGIWAYLEGTRTVEMAEASEHWATVEGTITAAALDERTSTTTSHDRFGTISRKTSTRYVADVSYAYAVRGTEYEGATISFSASSSFDQPQEAQAVLDGYPVGAVVAVHYDPSHPERSVLEPGSEGVGWLRILGLALIAIGLVAPIAALRYGHKGRGN